ncbi:PH domain-containing protein [Flavobacterium sp.]|uniref:PH domain-containing protein n=1 Tax=Flavobacterium sp. TaxID=239 RepID=UPI0025C4E42D|nr:PH domain-containing protein [Flavobacterium sp.]
MFNTPLFNKGLTKDFAVVCTSCLLKLNNNGRIDMASKPIMFTNGEFKAAVDSINSLKQQIKADKKQAFDKKVEDYKGKINSQNERLAEIKLIVAKLNPSVVNKREIGELPEILTSDEVIEKLESGYLDEGKGSGHGLLIATNQRLIFIDKSMLSFGIKMEDFPYDRISSVSVETGFMKGILKIICSGNTAKINMIVGAKDFSEFIRQKTAVKPSSPTIVQAEPDILGQIEKLADLRSKGILTDDEFSSKKALLLEKL